MSGGGGLEGEARGLEDDLQEGVARSQGEVCLRDRTGLT